MLHQVLQWRHMVSSVRFFDSTTVPGMRSNTFADGLFHLATYGFTIAGLVFLWRAYQHGRVGTAEQLVGLFLIGFGSFNLVEGVLDHVLLGIHHVNETAPREQWLWWDLGFLLWGAAMVIAGWWLWRVRPARLPPMDQIAKRNSP